MRFDHTVKGFAMNDGRSFPPWYWVVLSLSAVVALLIVVRLDGGFPAWPFAFVLAVVIAPLAVVELLKRFRSR
ncbi:MAG: hypothetical protein INR70_06570 [Parafilimonas terrae]|nr:hypothetical protein [Parafilimonas terrae]